MPLIIADRVLEQSTTTGTGAFTLSGASLGFRSFGSVCSVADTVWYYIEGISSFGVPTGEYEYGLGTYSAANQLTRTTVRGSSNGGSAVNFTAGTKLVGISVLAPDSLAAKNEWLDALGVGDYVSATVPGGSAASLSSNASVNITSIPLPKGEWDVQGTTHFDLGGGGTTQRRQASVSTVSGAIAGDTQTGTSSGGITAGYVDSVQTPVVRLVLAAPADVYLVTNAIFTGAAMISWGSIRARKARPQ